MKDPRVDDKIASLGDWREAVFTRLRKWIHEAVPACTEDVKWRGTPTFEHHGIMCTGETYKAYVKLTFAKGASLPDPKKLFNASLEGNARRAIDVREGDKLDEKAFKALMKAAAAANQAKPARTPAKKQTK